jgi:lysophospholipase L1-like esterase
MMMSKALLTVERYFSHNITTQNSQVKIVDVIGDSYVANHRRPKTETWHYLWATEHGIVYNNYGRNGNCVAFDRTKEGFGPSMLMRYRQMDPNADLVIIIAGHNDAGKINHNADSLAMFRDSMSLLINGIRQHCPHAELVWITPWYVDRPGFEEVCKTIKQVCRKKKVRVLDNYSPKCIIKVRDVNFRKRYFQSTRDTAHLNAAGHKLYLPVAEKFLKRYLK